MSNAVGILNIMRMPYISLRSFSTLLYSQIECYCVLCTLYAKCGQRIQLFIIDVNRIRFKFVLTVQLELIPLSSHSEMAAWNNPHGHNSQILYLLMRKDYVRKSVEAYVWT